MKSLERVMLFNSNEQFIADLNTNTIVTTEIEGLDGESRLIFDYPLEQSDVSLITEGCFIAIPDLDGTDEEYLLFEIVSLTQDDVVLQAECTHDYYNLAKGEIITWATTSENVDMPLGTTLANERYQLGIVQINRPLTRDRKNVNPLESLRYIEKEWGGELRFRITITFDYQINRYVDHLTRRGVFVGNRFEFGHNMSEFSHVIETAHIITASYGFGQTPQAAEGEPEPEPITFADIEWAIANGDPTDKPLGQIWVGDDVARLAYGRADGMGGKKHKFMNYDSGQSETAEGLLWESWRQVQMSNFPLVNMAAKVIDLGSINPNFSHERARLGDDHFIIADVKGKPVELKSRIIKFTRRRQNPTDNEVELGNFLPTASNQIIDISKKVDLIEKRQGEPTSTLPDTTSPIDASRIQGILDTINVEVRSSLGYVYQDENGILLLNAPKDANPTKAMLLSGGAFFLANSKLVDGSWDWRGFGDGDGFMADEIVGGRIKTDLVEIFGNANFKWNGNNIYITDPTNSLKQIRIGLYNGTDYGIGFTTDGGTSWKNALSFDGLTISVSNVDGLAAEFDTRDTDIAAALQRAVDAENAAKQYADQQIASTNQDVADVNSSVGDLNTYVDGAFKDGVFEATEAIAIQKYFNVIDTEKADVDNKFTAIYNNAQLTGTPKTNLDTAKTAFNLAHANLTNSINAAILDGATTAAEKTDVNAKFTSFRTAIQTLATRFEEAIRAIEQAKATQALTDAKADTTAKIATVNQTITNLNTYVDGAFEDGVIEAAEAKAIEKYLNSLNAEKGDIDNRYTIAYADASLIGTPKTNLATAKTAYNTAHANLLTSINTAITDGKTTAAEKTDVDSKFGLYRTALSTFATRFEEAIRAIEQAKATAAENAAKADTTAKIATVNQTITNLNTYVDGAFEDGVIEQAESTAIEKYLNSLNTEKLDVDNRYTIIYADASLTGTPKTALATAKTAYNTAHTNLIASINTAITDGKTTVAEKTDVDSKFTAYKNALGTLATRFEEATRAIEQAKATAAENAAKADTTAKIATVNQTITNLNTYVDGAFEDGVIEMAESKAIEKYLNSLNTEKLDVDNRYTIIYADASLTGTPKTNLATAKTAYGTAHTNLITSINTAIADGKTTVAEKTDVDAKFTAYKTALGTLATRIEEATRAIEQAKATAAENAAKADTTAKIATVNQTITNLNTYVDGAFEDGVIEAAEAKAIEKYLNSLNTDKLDVDNRYTILYADATLTGTPKTNLLNAKTAYNTAHANLLTSINAAIADGKTNATEKTDVDTKFGLYKTALGTLATRFEEAAKAAAQAKATAAELAAKSYADAEMDLEKIRADAYADGIVTAEEQARIAQAEANLAAAKRYVQSRGENLVTNGTGLLGDNTNFSPFIFDGSEAYYTAGSFKKVGAGTIFTDELMPVNPELRYLFSQYAKTLNGVGKYFAMVTTFDVDGLAIGATNHMYKANTLTTLAAELKNGDTVVKLTSAANWDNTGTAGVNTHLRSIILWNYQNSYGYLYPPETYSRNWTGNAWNPAAIDLATNTITLRVPWAGGTIPIGTPLSNGSSGGSYKYLALSNTVVPQTWTNYTGIMSGVDLTGTNASYKFPPGTANAKIGWLMNYQSTGETAWFANVFFAVDVETTAGAQAKADAVKQYADQQLVLVRQDVTDVSQDVTDLNTYVDGSFEDGIIQMSEAKAIGTYINSLNTEKNELDNRYTAIYAEATLSGTPKTNLLAAKTAYNTAHTNLITSINTAIADGKTTTVEKTDVDTKFTAYKTSLATLSTRFEEAIRAIEQAKIAAIKIGGRNELVRLDELTDTYIDTVGAVTAFATHATTSSLIAVVPNEELAFSKIDSVLSTDEFFRYSWHTAAGVYISRAANSTNGFVLTVPATAYLLKVSYPMDSNPKVERGNKITGWTPAPEDYEGRFTLVENDVDDILFAIEDDQIIAKVTGSTTFTNALDEKANADIADELATKEELRNGVDDAKDYADEVIGNFDTSTFVTESEMIQTKEDFNFQLSKSSGVNLLKNSVGFAKFQDWAYTVGFVETQTTAELARLGFGSGFYFPPKASGNNRSIIQIVDVTPFVPYTLSYTVNKRNVSSAANSDGRFLVDFLTMGGALIAQNDIPSATITNGYERRSLTIIPTEGKVQVRVYAFGLADATITGLMLNLGDVALQWTMANGEMYNSNVRVDINGLRVESSAYKGYTQITPEEFAGYAEVPNASNVLEMQKVFTVNKDVTEMKKTKVEDEFTMPPIKIVTVTSASYTGWAFIADE